MIQNCKIIDTTLREGEQTPGVLFTLSDKHAIIDGLAKVGVEEVELGIGSKSISCLPDLLSYCRIHYPNLQTSIWSRCRTDDIEHTATLSPDVISLSIPVSDLHLHARLAKSRQWALEAMVSAIELAAGHGLRVAVGFEDASRADPDFLLMMAREAAEAGAFRLRLADTVGICSPTTISGLFTPLIEALPAIEFGVHTHNDFGMATANAIMALECGASWIDVTVMGLGERAGCARLEEIAAYLALRLHHQTIELQQLRPLAERVAGHCGVSIPHQQPIIGDRIFTCETGLHVQGLQNNPATYEPYAPEAVGGKRQLLYGSKTGRQALAGLFASLDLDPNSQLLQDRLVTLRDTAQTCGKPFTTDELKTILTNCREIPCSKMAQPQSEPQGDALG